MMYNENKELQDTAKRIHELPPSDVYGALGSRPEGLTGEEARERLARLGRNELQEKKGTPLIVRFLSNFTHMMAIMLWVAGLVAIFAQMVELGIAVWMVNIINGAFSFWQEFRAGKATEALKKMLPAYARVLRDGEEQRILAEELVPGDIMLLSEGDRISADARLVDDNDLKVNQSTLTGESHPVYKGRDEVVRADLSRSEHANIVFMGTTVAAGTGKAVVFSTGMGTEFGKIAGLTQALKEEPSPLQKEMGKITKTVTVLAVSIGIGFFLLSLLLAKTSLIVAFIFALGMVVAFVPEGLLPTVTLSLAMGVQRMAKRNALIKRLSAVETLGCTTVICTDKTGTLTQNEMTVSNLWTIDAAYDVTGVGYDSGDGGIMLGKAPVPKKDASINELLTAASLCSNARLVAPNEENSRYTVLGDPTEAALLVVAQKHGLSLEERRTQLPRIRELPFDSGRKRMSTIHLVKNRRIAYCKGAPKEVMELCGRIQTAAGVVPITDGQRQSIMAANDKYARSGLRVLAVAVRDLQDAEGVPAGLSEYTPELVERDLTFLGLVAMVDPPRPEVAAAVKKCHHAGIRIIMITGDYGLTAESIARRIGIVEGDRVRIVTGVELEKMDEKALQEALQGEVVFARVAPEQKLQVVTALQDMGHVVAVTGDGVNDSPALKKADIGVAMGITGTDVAKEAADMILTDDNFASIVNAVEEGRAVYNNIRKFVLYIFNSNMPEAMTAVCFLFSGGLIPLPLTVMQVLAIDLGTDMVPAMGLGVEAPEHGIMEMPPRSQKEPMLTLKLLNRAFLMYGMIESIFCMGSYFLCNYLNGWRPGLPLPAHGLLYGMATTATLAAIVACQMGMVFNCRTERVSVFKAGILRNKLILVGLGVEVVLLCLFSYVPFLNVIFNTAPLRLRDWGYLIFLPFIVLFLEELRKAVMRGIGRKTGANRKEKVA